MKTEAELAWGKLSRWFWLVVALLYTIPAIISLFPAQDLGWLDVPRTWEARIAIWGFAMFFWVLYVTHPRPRGRAAASALGPILLAIFTPLILHYLGFLWSAVLFWSLAALLLVHHFTRPRRRTVALTAAIFMTALPIVFLACSRLTGSPAILRSVQAPLWAIAAVMWTQHFRLRRNAKANPDTGDEECY
jgi:hypothetical protein